MVLAMLSTIFSDDNHQQIAPITLQHVQYV